jgi:hypothetical protein
MCHRLTHGGFLWETAAIHGNVCEIENALITNSPSTSSVIFSETHDVNRSSPQY